MMHSFNIVLRRDLALFFVTCYFQESCVPVIPHRDGWHEACFSKPAQRNHGDYAMSTAPRMNKTTTEELPADLVELAGLIAALPVEHRRTIEPVFNRVTESTKRRRRILNLVQDALAQLRLDMKYLVFDLEATRRERDDARHELEEGTSRGDE